MSSRRTTLPLVIACAMVVIAPLPASAQLTDLDPPRGPARVDISAIAGWFVPSDWSDRVVLGNISPFGIVEQVLVREVVVDPGPAFDATVTYWEGRYGLRVHAGYASSCVGISPGCNGDREGTSDVSAYRYDVGAAIGLLSYTPRRWVWPYVFLGVGGVTYDVAQSIGEPLGLVVSRPRGVILPPFIDDGENVLITLEDLDVETQLAFNFGVGTDVTLPLGGGGLGARIEFADLVHRSPIGFSISQIGGLFDTERDEVDFGPIHNLRFSAGVVLRFGR